MMSLHGTIYKPLRFVSSWVSKTKLISKRCPTRQCQWIRMVFVLQRRWSSDCTAGNQSQENVNESGKEIEENIILNSIDQENTRNFSIIAHVDHGKSTLADRLLEYTGTIAADASNKQVLDKLQVERERGITVKAQTVSMFYKHKEKKFLLNLIDTPGHVDFNYEVSRSLTACQGVLLVVDAAQGIQAQTVANFHLALNANLIIIPILNKIDMKTADPDRVASQIENLFGFDKEDILKVSAKEGTGIKSLLSTICEKIPSPDGARDRPCKVLLFDSWYSQFKGVICLVAVIDGELRKGERIISCASKEIYKVIDIGILHPNETSTGVLYTGQVGYIETGMRKTEEALIGDTFCYPEHMVTPSPGFRTPKAMVVAGFYPTDQGAYVNVRNALGKLTLNDSSVTLHNDTSAALGQGWRIGFLGVLHMEVFRQRLKQEYDVSVIVTTPNVPYKVTLKGKERKEIEILTPSEFPEPGHIEVCLEPVVMGTIIFPEEYMGKIITLCQNKRGVQTDYTHLDEERVILKYILPLTEVQIDFFDELKSISSGYASFDYEDHGYQETDITKIDILLNGNPVDALSCIVHSTKEWSIAKNLCRKLQEIIPRQLFEVVIQASVRGRIIARESIKPFRKDVTAKCYGGDITRKRKLLDRQKEGKKLMKKVGKVVIPHEAFLTMLKR